MDLAMHIRRCDMLQMNVRLYIADPSSGCQRGDYAYLEESRSTLYSILDELNHISCSRVFDKGRPSK